MTATPEEIRAALTALVDEKSDAAEAPPAGPEGCAVVCRLVESFLLWEASTTRAERALDALRSELVDLNELRVCLPSEIVGVIGVRYPLARERAERMRTCLRAVFEKSNSISLADLQAQSKRQARSMLDAIPGMVPYVAARVVLLELGGHAFPVDSRVRGFLQAINCESEDEASLSVKLERVFRAGEVPMIHRALERHFDAPARGKGAERPRPKSGSRAK